MMALQKSLMEQSDIVPVLQGFELQVTDNNEVIVVNPPVVKTEQTTKVVTSQCQDTSISVNLAMVIFKFGTELKKCKKRAKFVYVLTAQSESHRYHLLKNKNQKKTNPAL